MRINLYIPENFKNDLKKLRKALKKDGVSLSGWFRDRACHRLQMEKLDQIYKKIESKYSNEQMHWPLL